MVPHVTEIGAADLAEALAALDWPAADLDPALPPRIAYAGARHLVLAAATRERLADLAYDFARLEALMRRLDLTTLQLVWREAPEVFHVRDPFPVGGVVEDPATGAAAAAFGAYVRELGLVPDDRCPDPAPGRGHGPPRHPHGGAARRGRPGPGQRDGDADRLSAYGTGRDQPVSSLAGETWANQRSVSSGSRARSRMTSPRMPGKKRPAGQDRR